MGTDPDSPFYKVRIEGKHRDEGFSPIVAEYRDGHVIFYRGYNDPKSIAQQGGGWGGSDMREVDGDLVVTHKPLKYTPDQTTQHIILHEFGGHGLGNDHFDLFGGNLGDFMGEVKADEWVRAKMREYGFIE